MLRHEYDEDAAARWLLGAVVDSPLTRAQWLESRRRLDSVTDPLARRLVGLHRMCGTGDGRCDGQDVGPEPRRSASVWGCETLDVIAQHHRLAWSRPEE